MDARNLLQKYQVKPTHVFPSLVISVVLLWAMPASAAPNFAQVTDRTGTFCPGPIDGIFLEIPGLSLELKTQGKPVLVTFNVIASFGGNTILLLRPTIDGQPADPPPLWVQHSQGTLGEVDTLSWSRIYELDKGLHAFGVECDSQGGVSTSLGWLTVLEIKN